MAPQMGQAPAGGAGDQMPAGAGGAGDDESQESFVVCIAAMADGTFKIYSQDSDDDQDDAAAGSASSPAGDAAGGMGADGAAGGGMAASGGDGDSDSAQTASTIEEALKIAGQMLQEEGSEDAQESQGTGQDGNAPVSDPQAVWNQLAKKSDKSRGI